MRRKGPRNERKWANATSKGETVRHNITIVLVVLFVSGTGILVAGATSRGGPRWEYGTYVERADNYQWQQAGQCIEATAVKTFLRRMGLPATVEVDPAMDALANTLFNHLGAQGWELVTTTADSQGSMYWFKRLR
jgi:hypothetical protein